MLNVVERKSRLPLQCCTCKQRFEVDFESKGDVKEFHEALANHSATHPGKAPDYDHVDQEGILVSKSKSPEVQIEKSKLDKIAMWAQ